MKSGEKLSSRGKNYDGGREGGRGLTGLEQGWRKRVWEE